MPFKSTKGKSESKLIKTYRNRDMALTSPVVTADTDSASIYSASASATAIVSANYTATATGTAQPRTTELRAVATRDLAATRRASFSALPTARRRCTDAHRRGKHNATFRIRPDR